VTDPKIIVPKWKEARVRLDGTNVLLIVEGQLIAEWPWQVAKEIGAGLIYQGKLGEELAKHEKVIADGALLHRSGSPVGLAVNTKIGDEVQKEAHYNRKLRRALPNAVPSGSVFAPGVINTAPKEKPNGKGD
jgi:hypothetical protein